MKRSALILPTTFAALAACNGSADGVTSFSGNEEGSSGIGVTLTPGTSDGSGETTVDPSAGTVSATGTTSDTTPADTTAADTGPSGCTSDDDCSGDPGGAVCDVDNGTCVDCTPTDDPCAEGSYCDPGTNACVPGCIDDADCGGELSCDVVDNTCVGCFIDTECPAGSVCDGGSCVPGCNEQQMCPVGLACCSEQCVDVESDLDHCGGCDLPCAPANATGSCSMGTCGIAACDQGFDDCNGGVNDGCEVDGVCACEPNVAYACYSGPLGTQGVGICQAGTQTCNAQGTALGPCVGQVLPGIELCNSGADENCDGTVDEDPDLDGDGWTQCGGDCCDEIGVGCLSPTLVNPGAFEFGGNMVDDDCDGVIDNVLPTCDAALVSNSGSAADYARAMDLCQFTTANPPDPADRIWGVISSSLTLADGAGVVAANSRSIRNGFGSVITPEYGGQLAVFSTGHAADTTDANPSFAPFQEGQLMGTSSDAPADWLAANGDVMPNAPGCLPPDSNTAFNPVMLTLTVRVPTNAQSFSVMMYFFSAEYPEWVCTPYNDFFVALIDSTNATNPADGNIAIYDDGVEQWPLGVNILSAADGLFTQCSNGGVGQCFGAVDAYNGCVSTAELVGTGMDTFANLCGYNGRHGGGTGWLNMTGNVTPGEVVTLRFAIWDTADEVYDSVVLLDDFQWSVEASEPGVQPG